MIKEETVRRFELIAKWISLCTAYLFAAMGGVGPTLMYLFDRGTMSTENLILWYVGMSILFFRVSDRLTVGEGEDE